jgi:hypothetical protein
MATSHRVYSDLFKFSNISQQVLVGQGKNLLIDFLREYFKNDVFYRYETDAFGFPLTPNLTDLPPDIKEKRTTRIFIGDIYRMDKRFFPSITIRYSSGKDFPISFNQEVTCKEYRLDFISDSNGEASYIHVPIYSILAGAWSQSFEIIITTESIPDREELTDLVSLFFMGTNRQELYEAGLFVKNVSMGSEKEDDLGNKKIYTQTISLDTFSEWRIRVPIDANSLIDTINFCFQYGVFDRPNYHFVTDKCFINVDS